MSDKQTRIPVLSTLYEEYLQQQDSVAFEERVGQSYTQGTLQRLATHHLREVRRAAVLGLGFLGDYRTNDVMGEALLDDDRTVRLIASNGIRTIWTRAGSEVHRKRLAAVMRWNAGRDYLEAIAKATALIKAAPWFAEVRYQRSVAYFHLKQFPESIRDCARTLEINEYHFVAATSMGQAYLELENYPSALESFRRALRINPDLEGVRAQVIRLARMVEDK